MNASANDVRGCGIEDGHHGQTYQSGWKNAPNESENASRKAVSPSLRPWTSGVSPT